MAERVSNSQLWLASSFLQHKPAKVTVNLILVSAPSELPKG